MGYHKDMSKDELKEAGNRYVANTKECSMKAYEAAKPYALTAAEKTCEYSKMAWGKLMALVRGEETQEIDSEMFQEEQSEAPVEESVAQTMEEEVESEAQDYDSEE